MLLLFEPRSLTTARRVQITYTSLIFHVNVLYACYDAFAHHMLLSVPSFFFLFS